MTLSSEQRAGAADTDDDTVAEVAGPAFTALETASALSVGVLALVGAGLLALLLSALVDEHRLSAAGIGQAAMLEALSMGLSTALAGILLKPRALRLITGGGAALLVAVNLATLGASGASVLLVRTLAGVPEGVLLWIAVGLISRTQTPERWAAVLFTGMGCTQLIAATALSLYGLPRFGANGGYVLLAGVSALCLPIALFLPRAFGVVPGTEGATSGSPPLRGWVALLGTLGFSGSVAAVGVYVIPLAREAGLDTGVARVAVSVGLGCQILGGALATLLAGRTRYIVIFWACAVVFAVTWASYALHVPAWWFVAVSAVSGAAGMLGGPFLTPMTIEADPSRRAAVQSGAAQVLAGALGPFLASLLVSDHDVRGALLFGAGLMTLGLAVITWLHWTATARIVGAAP